MVGKNHIEITRLIYAVKIKVCMKSLRVYDMKIMENYEMTEEEAKNAKAVRYLGKAYAKVPYTIINRMLDVSPYEQKIGIVYMLLFTNCNYDESQVTINGNMYDCGAGELISTHEKLAGLFNMNISSFRRYVHILEKDGLVEVVRLKDAFCFRLNGYEAFMRNTEIRIPSACKGKKLLPPSDMQKEELKRFGNKKPRIDLLDF